MRNYKLIVISSFISFFICYLLGVIFYSGGSAQTPTATSFLWTENYFCDMMNRISLNGKLNPASIYSILALYCGVIGVSFFFLAHSKSENIPIIERKAITILGILSMFFTSFIYTTIHDYLIIIALITATIPFVLILKSVYLNSPTKHLLFTVGTLGFLTAYVLCFYLNILPETHPIIQKCAIVLGIYWIIRTILVVEGSK